jgi:L-fuculose-phosphate aldolase
MDSDAAKAEVINAGRCLVEQGLVSRTWGNVSCRIDERRMVITPSGIDYGRLTPSEIVVTDIETLEYEGGVKPSSEKGIHALAYRTYPEVNFVIHTHQNFATMLSVARWDSVPVSDDDKARLGGVVALAGYGLPGTKRLVRQVEAVFDRSKGKTVLMARHGALLCGKNRDEAFTRAIALEELCGTYTATPTGRIDCMVSDETAVALHREICRLYPAMKCVAHGSGPAAAEVLADAAILPVMLDDFAQLAGPDMKIVSLAPNAGEGEIRKAAALLRGRNCLGVRGLGILCCANTASDCQALVSLAEKNCLAFLHARQFGRAKALPLLDRLLMRAVYLRKYSKKF